MKIIDKITKTGDAYTKDVCVKRKAGNRYRIAIVGEDEYSTFVMMDADWGKI